LGFLVETGAAPDAAPSAAAATGAAALARFGRLWDGL